MRFYTCCLRQPVRVHAYTPAKGGNDAGSLQLPQFFVQDFYSTFVNVYIDC